MTNAKSKDRLSRKNIYKSYSKGLSPILYK